MPYTDTLMAERTKAGRIEINTETVQTVDRLYPGTRQLRYEDLCTVDPAHGSTDDYSARHIASLHNLYLDLYAGKYIESDDFRHGLILSLFGREDVFVPTFELQVNPDTNVDDYTSLGEQLGGNRQYHVVPINLNNNHFVVIIGDSISKKALYFDGFNQDSTERKNILHHVNEHYQAFLRVIGMPKVELHYGPAPHQTDAHSCGLIALEVVRFVFREIGADLSKVEEAGFQLTTTVTRTVGREPLADGGNGFDVIKTLLQAWLLWLERELGGDGCRRILFHDLHTAPGGGPRTYEMGIRVGTNELPQLGKLPMFSAVPLDVLENWLASERFRQNLDDELFWKTFKFLTEAQNNQRLEDLISVFRNSFQPHNVAGLSADEDDTDLPCLHACCSLSGWQLAGITGPYSASADTNLPYAFYKGNLSRHTAANVFLITQFLNWLKGSNFSYAELAAAALLDRTLIDHETEWEERKQRLNFALNALDNIAAAKTADPCHGGGNNLGLRCENWRKQDQDDLRESARFRARPAQDVGYVGARIRSQIDRKKVRQHEDVFFSFGLEAWLSGEEGGNARCPKRLTESENLHADVRAAAALEGLTDTEVDHYFLHHGTYFPFHISYRKKYVTEKRHWDVPQLYALARDEAAWGFLHCNRTAEKAGLGESDLHKPNNWTRVIFPIFIESLANLQRIKKTVKQARKLRAKKRGRIYKHNDLDPDFMDEVAYLLGDEEDRPISPITGSILRCVHEKRFDPRDAMLSGNQLGQNGERFTAPFTHGENFHLRQSFRMSARTVRFSTYLTNMIRGKEHFSLWAWSREIFRSIPPDAALSMLDPSLGERPWGAAVPNDPQHLGLPPRRTFSLEFPHMPVDDIIDQPFNDDGIPRPILLSCPSPACCPQYQDLPPGELLNHFLKEHSLLDNQCEDCGLTFFTPEALDFHKILCLPRQLSNAYKHYQEFGHHVGGGDTCGHTPGSSRFYAAWDLRNHLKICGLLEEDRLSGQFFCVCGLQHSHRENDVRRHQGSAVHEVQMKFERGESVAEDKHVCTECGTLLGASPYTNSAHEQHCALKKEMWADGKAFEEKYKCTIVLDGAVDKKAQEENLKLFKSLATGRNKNARKSAAGLIRTIDAHPPPSDLPRSNKKVKVCDTCLATLSVEITEQAWNTHRASKKHLDAKNLLRCFQDPEHKDPKTDDDFKRLCHHLQTAYHGQDPTLVSNALRRMYFISIPPTSSPEEFRELADHYLGWRFPNRGKYKQQTVLERILALNPATAKFGACDCIDCCVFTLFSTPNKAKNSPHRREDGHMQNAGFLDGMVELMGGDADNKDDRVRSLLEIRQRYMALASDNTGSDDDEAPPKKRNKLASKSAQPPKNKKGGNIQSYFQPKG